jgi:hypothetical protein
MSPSRFVTAFYKALFDVKGTPSVGLASLIAGDEFSSGLV